MEEPFALLRGKLGAARVVLDGVTGAQRVAISRGQANAFLDMFGRIGSVLTSEQRATLQALAVNARFEDRDATTVLSQLAGPSKVKTGRAHSQDYRSFIFYISEERWTALLSEDLHSHVKESILTALLRSLGAHLPCELSFKRLASLLMMLSNSSEDLQRKTLKDKKTEVRLLKQNWHLENRRLSKPDSWVEFLPNDPAAFRDGPFKVLYDRTFTSHQPVAPKIDMRTLMLLDASFKARSSQDLDPGHQLAVPQLSLESGNSATLQAMQSMGNVMIQGMQQMCSQQAKMMEYMMGTPSPKKSEGRDPAGLRTLLDKTSPRGGIAERALKDLEVFRAETSAMQAAKVAAEEEKKAAEEKAQAAIMAAKAAAKVAAEEKAAAVAAEEEKKAAEKEKTKNLAAKAQAAIMAATAAAAKGPAAPADDPEDDLPLDVSCVDPATAAREQASKMLDAMEKRDKARELKRKLEKSSVPAAPKAQPDKPARQRLMKKTTPALVH